jgi:hypothetical protein
LTPNEQFIVDKSYRLYEMRLKQFLIDYFKPLFPKLNEFDVMLRVHWFFREMQKLAVSYAIEDSEWNHNRNEEAEDFDDFKWWDNLNAKIKTEFPNGVFTLESYGELENYRDEIETKAIQEYFYARPDLVKKITRAQNKKT